MTLCRFTEEENLVIQKMLEAYYPANRIAKALGRNEGVVRQRIFHNFDAGSIRDGRLVGMIAIIARTDPESAESIRMIAEHRGRDEGWAVVKTWRADRKAQLRAEREQAEEEQKASGQRQRAMVREAEKTFLKGLTRNERIAWIRECAGWTLEDIGNKHGITRERVRQIVKKTPLPADVPVYDPKTMNNEGETSHAE